MKLLFLFLFPVLVVAQPCKKMYRDKLETGSKLISCDIMYTLEKTKQGNYIYKQYYPDTKVVTQWITFEDKKMEIKEGPFIEYWDNGTILNKGMYADNQKEGEWIENTYEKGFYRNGQRDGLWTIFRKDFTVYYEKNYQDGINHGPVVYYDVTGNIQEEAYYEMGKLTFTTADTTKETRSALFSKCDETLMSVEEKNQCAQTKLLQHIYSKIRYPARARELGINGKALISFVIDVDGKVIDVEIINGLCEEIRNDLYRLISDLPAWEPGLRYGIPKKTSLNLPLMYKLE
jgi:hypothetical protein